MVPASTVRAFIEAINCQSAERLAALMTEDHTFIDALANNVCGKEAMREAWRAYFRMVPDYRLVIDEIFQDGSKVVLIGWAQGTWTSGGPLEPRNFWSTPVALRAEVRDSLIAEWRVFADNEPIRRLIAAAK